MADLFTEYAPGDVAPHTGAYRVYHQGHRVPHEVVLHEGETFPRCKRCDDGVRFEPVIRATAAESAIADDQDFVLEAA